MKNQQIPYCRLIHYSFCHLAPKKPFKIVEIWFSNSADNYAYVEEYNNINLIEARIDALNSEWQKKGIIGDYFMIALRNRWEDEIFIGIYNYAKWYASSMSIYSLECLNNERQRELNFQRQKIIYFYMPYETTCSFSDLIQKQNALKMIKEWLDTGTYTQYFFGESGAIETRKYTPPIPIPLEERSPDRVGWVAQSKTKKTTDY